MRIEESQGSNGGQNGHVQPAKSPPNQRREPSRGTEKNAQNAGSARKNDR